MDARADARSSTSASLTVNRLSRASRRAPSLRVQRAERYVRVLGWRAELFESLVGSRSSRPSALRQAAAQGRAGQRRGLAVRVRAEEQNQNPDAGIEALEARLGSRKGGKGGGTKNINKVRWRGCTPMGGKMRIGRIGFAWERAAHAVVSPRPPIPLARL